MFEISDKNKKIIFIGLTILLFILFIVKNNNSDQVKNNNSDQVKNNNLDQIKNNNSNKNSECCNNSINQEKLKYLYPSEESNLDIDEETDIVIMNFNTDWCYYSKKFQPIWDEFSKKMKGQNIIVKDVKCDNNSNETICKKYDIEGFPTVKLLKDKKIHEFKGNRSVDGLTKFVREHL